MAPTKSMQKPLKIEKPIIKPIKKKSKRRSQVSFNIYIYKLLRSLPEEDLRISRKSMMIMNDIVHDLLERIAAEASRFVMHGKRNTLSSREVQSALKLILPGEIYKHANMEAMKAIDLYHRSQEATKN